MLLQIAGKQAGYRAMSEYYQSLVCKSNKSIGEEIARLEVGTIYRDYFYNECTLSIGNSRCNILSACGGAVQGCSAEIEQAESVSRLCQQSAEKLDGGEKG